MKTVSFDPNFPKCCSCGSNYEVSIGSGYGLVLRNRWEAITWTNADPVQSVNWPIYRKLSNIRRIKYQN